MALSRVSYTQTMAGNKTFIIPFQYISESDVKVFVNEEPVDYSWLNPQLIQLDEAPAVGDVILIKRVTERNVLLVDFQDGSTITADQLDLLGKQSFYLVQEADDLAVESNSLALAATEVAQAADEKADQAVETANTALGVANEALGNSEVAVSLANAASISAAEAEASALAANESAQAAAENASTAIQMAAQIEDTIEQLLEDVQDIAGNDLTDFAKNSENLSGLTDKAAARSALGLGTAATHDVTTS
ncbi:MAG: phage tail fiber protein, partial [Sphaerochaetaceae bacterium]